jgi:hypothetical protein
MKLRHEPFSLRWNLGRLFLAALPALSAAADPARGEPDPCAVEPVLGCGKAQAMACRFFQEPAGEAGGLREALGDTDVQHVALDIELTNINPGANTCTITGTNTMTVKSKSAALTQFTFRLRDNYTITSLVVTDDTGPHAVTHTLVPNRTRIVTLNRTFGMDEEFDLTIAYTGNSVSAGFGSIDVGTHGGGNPVVATLSEAFYAYSWWPAKDGDVGQPGDNGDKTTIGFNLTVPSTYVVASNGLLQGVDTLSGSRKRYRWASNYPISTYLVSFAATNYNTWTQTYSFPAGPYNPAGTMPVEFYIYPGNDTPANRTSWEKCLNMLAVFRGVYGEYPFVAEKYGIYNFNFGGGMEHQTMTGQGGFSEGLTSHELAHQWWGDHVTCRTWRDIWLNEGFATYGECLWEERKAGGINTAAYFSTLNAHRPTGDGAGDSVYVYDTSSMSRIFSSTYSYNKAAWVLHMLRHVVGDSVFFDNILPQYRAAFQGSAATTADFAGVASAASGRDLSAFFDQWVLQRGAPTYQYGWASVNVDGQNYLLARIAQTQVATTGSPPQVPSVFVMPIDLSATIGGSPQTLVVQNDARTEWFVVPVSGPVSALSFDPGPYILRGAATSAAYQPGPPKIVAASPPPGAAVPQLAGPSQLSLTFHTPVNAATAHFTLVGDTTGAQSVSLAAGSGVNPAVLNLAGALPADTYTLTVTSGVTAVNSGMALDGEIADPLSPASLPSGDGLAGGSAVLRFTVVPCSVSADIDGDCDRDPTDLDLFVDVLLGNDVDPLRLARSDLDGSGTADGSDVAPFVIAYLAP